MEQIDASKENWDADVGENNSPSRRQFKSIQVDAVMS